MFGVGERVLLALLYFLLLFPGWNTQWVIDGTGETKKWTMLWAIIGFGV